MPSPISSYPKVYNLGHPQIAELFEDVVQIEEKIDGSQFSFGVFDGELQCRSKGVVLNLDAPEKMFIPAIATASNVAGKVKPGYTYRCEFLGSPNHNTLCYDRVPNQNLIVFDIMTENTEEYLNIEQRYKLTDVLGLEVVPVLAEVSHPSEEFFRELLETTSVLGGVKIEGVVAKNYQRFGRDGKPLFGKHVSEEFKEVHRGSWNKKNPKPFDVLGTLIEQYGTPARYLKAVQHMTEEGRIEHSPRDIGPLINEVRADVLAECEEEIKEQLFKYYWPKIERGISGKVPGWYKDRLIERQFDGDVGS